jgi:hypothetical protein
MNTVPGCLPKSEKITLLCLNRLRLYDKLCKNYPSQNISYFYLDFLNLLLHFLLCELAVRLVSCLCFLHNLGQRFNYNPTKYPSYSISENIPVAVKFLQTKITQIFGRIKKHLAKIVPFFAFDEDIRTLTFFESEEEAKF